MSVLSKKKKLFVVVVQLRSLPAAAYDVIAKMWQKYTKFVRQKCGENIQNSREELYVCGKDIQNSHFSEFGIFCYTAR